MLLVVLQAVAWGATVALVGMEMRRSIDPESRDVWGGTAAAAAGTVLLVMTPLAANPFLFDLRPDLVAVPLATAGFIRARRLGDWDARAVALLLSSLLAREEMMMTVVAALLTTPWGRASTMPAPTPLPTPSQSAPPVRRGRPKEGTWHPLKRSRRRR